MKSRVPALLPPLETEIVIPVCALEEQGDLIGLPERGVPLMADHEEPRRIRVEEWFAQMKQDLPEGAKAFLFTECRYGGVFMVAFAILIFLCLGSVEGFSTQSQPCRLDPSNMCKPALATAVFSAVSFLLGAFTSVLSGFLGMQIAIYANARTALEVEKGVGNVFSEQVQGVGKAFFSAFRSGAVMGFLIAANGLVVLYIAINLFKLYYGNDWEGLFEAIAGYGLGASSMALFGRGTGGIYATAANVCCHSSVDSCFLRSAVIFLNVGDIVGDIAGAGTDLFGSYVESSCAALVVASISSFGNDHNFTAMCYPLLISSMGVLVCLMTTLFTARSSKIEDVNEIKPSLRKQLIISTILMTSGIVIVSWIALPSSFTVYNFGSQKVVKNWQLCFCVGVGLWAGLTIEFITKSFTNDEISRFQEFAAEGADFGLAFVNIPTFAFLSILLSYRIASVYGIAVAAVGMLSTIATRLAINPYSPISDNAKRAVKTTDRQELRVVLSSSNTRVTIGKVFAIESTSLVSMALFGAFASRAAISPVDVLTPKVFTGSIVGAMLPKWFSAMTMKRVGAAAFEMGARIYRKSDHDRRFFKIPIDASFRGMIRPVALVMLTPLIVGTFFGVEMLSGVLAGSLGSVVRIAISASNTDGAWEEAKKYIRAGASEYAKTKYAKTSYSIKFFWDFDNRKLIGDPLKDTSGPPLNILIQLMAVESLVFAPFFTTHGGLLFKIF